MQLKTLLLLSMLLSLGCRPRSVELAVMDDPSGPDLAVLLPDRSPMRMCTIGPGRCEGDVSFVCLSDGTIASEYCDPVQGSRCDPATFRCTGPCARSQLGSSYIGCEYFPTVTANAVSTDLFHFAVAVSNTAQKPAEVVIEDGALPSPLRFVVSPGSVQVQILPWVDALAFGRVVPASGLNRKGAYHLRSTQPVTVYQFNALEYQIGSIYSYSNDASLLLPSNVLGQSYRIALWPAYPAPQAFPGLIAVTATQDGTTVTLTAKAESVAANGAPAFMTGVPTSVRLDRGDVLQVLNSAASPADFTGSHLVADHAVQVIAGHYCTRVPITSPACDHLEDALLPTVALGMQYIVTAPALPSLPDGKVEWVRIIATESDTHLSFDPEQGASKLLKDAGDFIELPRNANDFMITADKKIVVMQYMAGQGEGGDAGDPAMAVVVPVVQYRRDYQFHAPLSYASNYANVIAPLKARVVLDGAVVNGLAAIGNSGFAVARVQLANGINGNHTISSDQPFGLTVYGYGTFTSYWYPGGLDLKPIP